MKCGWLACGVVIGVLGCGAALADEPANGGDAELLRLTQAAGRSVKWNHTPAGRSERYGHAEVLISAPLPYVRELVLDYAHYKDFSGGKFKTSRVVDKSDAGTDVYIQVPVLHGMLTLWQVLRFGRPVISAPGTETVEGTFVKGNVRSSNVRFSLRAVGDRTILKADLSVVPDFAAPQSMVDEELRDAAQNAVDAVQARAQTRYAQVLAQRGSEATPHAVASASASQ